MAILIEQARYWEDYEKAWVNGMKHLNWFEENRLFDYDREEEIEDLQKDFGKPGSLFLVAKSGKRNMGALRVKLRGNTSIFRGWEPAVPFEERSSGVGEALLEEAFRHLKLEGSEKAVWTLKYPYNSSETALWHINLYRKFGFNQRGPAGILLLADLKQQSSDLSPSTPNFTSANCDDFALEELADFILRAYAETPEDKAIHSWDPMVSNRKIIIEWLQSRREGRTGFCPPNGCKVALIEDKPAGFVGSFILRSQNKPSVGMLGPVGVFPEYRRRGIAYSLTLKIHEVLKEHKCQYSLVGTPMNNHNAIKLYKKIGYLPIFEQTQFEKELTHIKEI